MDPSTYKTMMRALNIPITHNLTCCCCTSWQHKPLRSREKTLTTKTQTTRRCATPATPSLQVTASQGNQATKVVKSFKTPSLHPLSIAWAHQLPPERPNAPSPSHPLSASQAGAGSERLPFPPSPRASHDLLSTTHHAGSGPQPPARPGARARGRRHRPRRWRCHWPAYPCTCCPWQQAGCRG